MGYIIGGVVAVIVIAVAAYYMARFMKGSVSLDLGNRTSFRSNEQITGKVSMELKKPSRGLLKAALVGEREERRRSSSGNGDTKTWQEFFRTEQLLEDEQDFQGGFTKIYNLEITTPDSSMVHGGMGSAVNEMIESTDKIPDGIKKFAQAAVSTASRGFGRLRWKVEVRFDAEGVDLYTSKRVKLTLTE